MIDNSDNNCDMRSNGEFEIIRKYIPSAQVVVDVGLEYGVWTKAALSVNPTAEYHCFEPNVKVIPKDLPDNVIVKSFGITFTLGSKQ